VHNQQTIPFVADGKANEWGENLLYDPKSGLLYKVSNDDNNLYIMLKIVDENSQRKMLMGGLSVWIDTTNHKKEIFGVIFPRGRRRGTEMSNPQAMRENRTRKRAFNVKEQLAESELEIEVRLYDYTEPHLMFLNESHLKPVIDVDSAQIIVYEFAVPLGYIIKNKKITKPISVGFVIGSENSPNSELPKRGQDEMGEGRVGGMGGEGMRGGRGGRGVGGGGMRGGRGGGSQYSGTKNGASTMEPSIVWFKDYVLNPPRQK
jgi:hypothetical protein